MRSKRKFNKSLEWVIEEYLVKNRTRREVAEECGLTVAGFKSYLALNNIAKPSNKIEISKEELSELIEQNYTLGDLTKHFKCSESLIQRRCKLFGLKIKAKKEHIQYDDSKDEMIISLYNDGLSSNQIARIVNLSHRAVLNHLIHCGIERRSFQESQFAFNKKEIHEDLKSYEKMYDLYVNKKMTIYDLGFKYDCSNRAIITCLKHLNIKLRNDKKVKERKTDRKGYFYFRYRLRTYISFSLVNDVLTRDNFTCQMCGSKEQLHIHHIKKFKDIVDRILEEHSDLNVYDNFDELYEIAIKDSELNDLGNLITLCRKCHAKVHGRNFNKDEVSAIQQ